MIYLTRTSPESMAIVNELLALEGKYVPKTLSQMLEVYGDRYSDEKQIERRASYNNGDGSDAVHYGFPQYARLWMSHRKYVAHWLHEELSNDPFSFQYLAVQNADDVAREYRQSLKAKEEMEEKPARSEFDIWSDIIPQRYKGASMDEFPTAMDHFNHICGGGSMLMLGPTGVGKTRFVWAMASELAKEMGGNVVKVTTLQEMLARIRSRGGDWCDEAQRLYGESVWLFVDECDKVNGSENDFIIVSSLVNKRYEQGMSTVFVGNGTRDTIIAKLGEPVVSRLTAGNEKGKLLMLSGRDRRAAI